MQETSCESRASCLVFDHQFYESQEHIMHPLLTLRSLSKQSGIPRESREIKAQKKTAEEQPIPTDQPN
jgi:hypothetical protein